MSKMNSGYDTAMITRTSRDANIIRRVIDRINERCLVNGEGYVLSTLDEITAEELRRVYFAAKRIAKRWDTPWS